MIKIAEFFIRDAGYLVFNCWQLWNSLQYFYACLLLRLPWSLPILDTSNLTTIVLYFFYSFFPIWTSRYSLSLPTVSTDGICSDIYICIPTYLLFGLPYSHIRCRIPELFDETLGGSWTNIHLPDVHSRDSHEICGHVIWTSVGQLSAGLISILLAYHQDYWPIIDCPAQSPASAKTHTAVGRILPALVYRPALPSCSAAQHTNTGRKCCRVPSAAAGSYLLLLEIGE